MNFKEILLNIIFFSAVFYLSRSIYYYFYPVENLLQEKAINGAPFTAPTDMKNIIYPLDLSVNLDENEVKSCKGQTTTIETEDAIWKFSSAGAVIENISYKRNINGKNILLNPFENVNYLQIKLPEQSILLLTFNQGLVAPYAYELESSIKNDNQNIVKYVAQNDNLTIHKQFIVYDTGYKVDFSFKVSLNNKSLTNVKPMILFPSPLLNLLGKTDKISTVLYSNDALIRKTPAQLANLGWQNPCVFGTQDLYFLNILSKDESGFISRGYYNNSLSDSRLVTILEGSSDVYNADLVFYFGPKTSDNLDLVDSKLTDLLDYGWLSFISKPFLKMLNLFNDYLGNYGWAIILLSLLLNLLSIPFVWFSEKSGRSVVALQKKLEYLEQNKNKNEDEINTLRLKHTRESITATIPKMLPFFFILGLTRVISSSIELYKASFLWIKDLAGADTYYVLPLLFWIVIVVGAFDMKDLKKSLFIALFAIVGAAFLNTIICAGAFLFFIANQFGSTILQPRIIKLISK